MTNSDDFEDYINEIAAMDPCPLCGFSELWIIRDDHFECGNCGFAEAFTFDSYIDEDALCEDAVVADLVYDTRIGD